MTPPCVPTPAAARARLAALDPACYARSRNHLQGDVSGLSPWITHGLISLPEVLGGLLERHPALPIHDGFVRQLGWRAWFRWQWAQRGEGIFQSLHPGCLPDHAYAPTVPADVREARSGVPVIDQAVRTLYATGQLHNHARLWLASYLVHVRQVHWRSGADWLYGHLLDGDLASNHLSWQWVAGTGSHQHYLFNADNVAKYAPPGWHCPGTVLDQSYEALGALARDPAKALLAPSPAFHEATAEPLCSALPPPDCEVQAPDAALVEGREVWLVHPWSLGELPALPPDTLVLGLYLAEFHQRWPWSARRWRFVDARMRQLSPLRWQADLATLRRARAGARRVRSVADPHLAAWLPELADCVAPLALFPAVPAPCRSFSQWWPRATRGLQQAAELLTPPTEALQP